MISDICGILITEDAWAATAQQSSHTSLFTTWATALCEPSCLPCALSAQFPTPEKPSDLLQDENDHVPWNDPCETRPCSETILLLQTMTDHANGMMRSCGSHTHTHTEENLFQARCRYIPLLQLVLDLSGGCTGLQALRQLLEIWFLTMAMAMA